MVLTHPCGVGKVGDSPDWLVLDRRGEYLLASRPPSQSESPRGSRWGGMQNLAPGALLGSSCFRRASCTVL